MDKLMIILFPLILVAFVAFAIRDILRQNSPSKWFYILLVVLVPIIGVPIYYMLTHRQSRIRKGRFAPQRRFSR